MTPDRATRSLNLDVARRGGIPAAGFEVSSTGPGRVVASRPDAPDLAALVENFFGGVPPSDRKKNFVPFFRRVAGRVENPYSEIGSFSLADLHDALGGRQRWLPELVKALDVDAYAGAMATMYRPGRRFRQVEKYVPAILEGKHVEVLRETAVAERTNWRGFPVAYRETAGARFLLHAAVDIDLHDAPDETRPEEIGLAVAAIIAAHRRKLIPRPSLVLHSGRGVWCFFRLVDDRNPTSGTVVLNGVRHDPATALRASSLAVRRLELINSALAETLRESLFRVRAQVERVSPSAGVRVPGSMNTAVDERAVLEMWFDIRGTVAVYTLQDLAAVLDVDLDAPFLKPGVKRATTLSAAQVAQRRAAAMVPHRLAFDRIVALAGMRGGMREGCRHLAVMHLARAGYRAGLDPRVVDETVHAVGRACRPPVAARQVEAELAHARKAVVASRKPPRLETVVRDLGVTAVERDALGWYRKARPARTRPTQAERHRLIREILAGRAYMPHAKMRAALAARGVRVSQPTVSRDYDALGILRPAAGHGTPLLD